MKMEGITSEDALVSTFRKRESFTKMNTLKEIKKAESGRMC